ncbi:MAG: tRNA glutamyl-Q(34) synthetase GluQRS [Betaproteobacteria bacterium]|nr:tRNA glutamyl-Q(34) synthetase GluQRS [Betaproteobacteria bacterium]
MSDISQNTHYRGRFAPSPSGQLHFGSLAAAVGSFLDARSRGGSWLLRMEDVDRPRCQSGAADDILRTLAAFGFEWDGPVLYQNTRDAAYAQALAQLHATGRVFPCACSRRELADSQLMRLAGDGAKVYPGTCRAGLPQGKTARAWRLRVDDAVIAFEDGVQGRIEQNLASEAGDFVLLRADGLFAYQLAVVVDDAEQGITHVVRGADLLDSTPRQILLQRLLALPVPAYVHLPVAVDARGEKLSKRSRAVPLNVEQPQPALRAALNFLGQAAPMELERVSLAELWRWAREHWNPARIPRQRSLSAPE